MRCFVVSEMFLSCSDHRCSLQGVLERDARDLSPLPDGVYLLVAFMGHCAAPDEVQAIHDLTLSRTIQDAIRASKQVSISANWLLTAYDSAAGDRGHIALQQSGALPRRFSPQTTGLAPFVGSREGHAWRGMVDPDELLTVLDPPRGFLVTANNLVQNKTGIVHCLLLYVSQNVN
jgi:acyl-homoserine lactone acylase PvdQ